MASRRTFLGNLATLGLGGAAVWLLRDWVMWPKPAARLADGAASSGWLPFIDPSDSILSIPLAVAGERVTALVDSGAQLSVIDKGLAQRLRLGATPMPVLAFGLNGAPQLGFSVQLALQAGDLSLRGLNAAELDLASLPVPTAAQFSVILGQNALSALVADIDFPRRRIAFHLPQGFTPPDGARQVPARLEGRRLAVEARVQGVPVEAVVDTGASAVLALSSAAARRAGLLEAGGDGSSGRTVTLGGASRARIALAQSLEFAGERYRDVEVQIYDGGGFMLPNGLLGLGALRRFRVILDLGQGRLFIVGRDPA